MAFPTAHSEMLGYVNVRSGLPVEGNRDRRETAPRGVTLTRAGEDAERSSDEEDIIYSRVRECNGTEEEASDWKFERYYGANLQRPQVSGGGSTGWDPDGHLKQPEYIFSADATAVENQDAELPSQDAPFDGDKPREQVEETVSGLVEEAAPTVTSTQNEPSDIHSRSATASSTNNKLTASDSSSHQTDNGSSSQPCPPPVQNNGSKSDTEPISSAKANYDSKAMPSSTDHRDGEGAFLDANTPVPGAATKKRRRSEDSDERGSSYIERDGEIRNRKRRSMG